MSNLTDNDIKKEVYNVINNLIIHIINKNVKKLNTLCYHRIAEYLINPHKQYTSAFFHKIFNIFKNSHKDFLKIVVDYYIRSLQLLYKINVDIQLTEDTKYMIQDKILCRIMNKKSISSHTELKDFRNNNKIFEYKNIRAKQRKFIYFLAIFNGYIWYSITILSGYSYAVKPELDRKINKLIMYETNGIYGYKLQDLQKYRIASIDFFELCVSNIKKGDCLYKLKVDEQGYNIYIDKIGIIHERKDLKLYKIF